MTDAKLIPDPGQICPGRGAMMRLGLFQRLQTENAGREDWA